MVEMPVQQEHLPAHENEGLKNNLDFSATTKLNALGTNMNQALFAENTIEKHNWYSVCDTHDILPDTGVCALVLQRQIAIFYSRRLQAYFALDNYDPLGRAYVLSRGIIGSIGDRIVVASPLYKHHFDLRTGECLEEPDVRIWAYPVRVVDGQIQVQV